MRVLMLGPTHPHRGGITHYTTSLVNALQGSGSAELAVLSFHRMFPRVLYKGQDDTGAQLVKLDKRVPVHRILHYGSPVSWRRAGRLLKDTDILHIQCWTGFLAPSLTHLAKRARKQGIRVLVTLHNVTPHERRDRIFQPMTRRLLRQAHGIVVHSESLRTACANEFGIELSRIHVVPHGRYDHFNQSQWTRSEARRSLGLDEEDVAVLCFGTIRPYKGVDLAIESMASLPAQYKLVIAGEPWQDWQAYDALIAKLGLRDRVIVEARYIPDDEVERFFRAADIALYPYRKFQGQSGAALAAVSFGMPMVGTPPLREAGIIAAVCCAQPDPRSIAEVLVSSYEAQHVRVAPLPSWEESATTTLALYQLS